MSSRRRGRTIGTLIIGACALAIAVGYLSGRPAQWRPFPSPAKSVSIRPSLEIGAPVVASDGSLVGKVVWVSKDYTDRISRIRFASPRALGIGEKVMTVRHDLFTVRDHAVHLLLSPKAVDALPEAMPADDAAAILP